MSLRRLACLILFVLAVAVPATYAAGPATDVSFGTESVDIVSDGAFARLALDGCRHLSEVGRPELPMRVLRFVIPGDMRVSDVVISYIEEQELSGTHVVSPAQPEVPTGETAEWVDPDAAIYGSDDLYPAGRIEYLGDGYLGGYRIASVAVYPVQYAPRSGRLVLATDISLELDLEPDVNRAQPRRRMTADSDRLYRKLVAGIVENPWAVSGKLRSVDVVDGVGPEGFAPRYTPSLEGSPVEYVIITNEQFQPYFQDLADWKTKKGVPTVIRTVSWIEDSYPGGTDTAERIRFFIKDAYESWGATYFLMGGDTNIVPVRYGWSAYYGGWDVSSDLYYSDLDENWDDDGDSKFGEGYAGVSAPGDSIDMYPDVFVGRAPAATTIEVETFVDKTLIYERSCQATFTDRNLFMAEVLFPYDWEPGDLISTDGAEHVVEPVLPLIPSWIHNCLLYQNYEPFPESFPLTAQTAIDSMNVGYNITSHVGHGNKDILRCSKNDYVTIQDVDALTNGQDRAGFMWMLNCTSTKIEEDCIAEHFMNNPNGGSALLFGPSRFCFPTTAKDYFYEWFRLLYQDGVERAGVVSAMCKVPFVAESQYDNTDRWTQMSYMLLGDPETRIWTAKPVALSAVHDATVQLGTVNLAVTILDPAAVDSALVCVTKGTEVYATGYTNASGQVTLSFTPKTTGTMTITATARNHYPYEDTIGVTSTTAAHVSLRGAVVDDDAIGSSDGNANTRAEAGETVEIDITVGNGGMSQATAVTATLRTADTYASLVDSTESLGNLSSLSVLPFDAAFAVSIGDDCPNDHEIEFTIQFDEASRASWSSDFTFKTGRPIPVQLHNDYDDGNDGIPEIGETITLTIDILNEGNGDADQLTGTLRYPQGEVTITDSTDTWGDVDASTSASGAGGFVFTITDSVKADFELEIQDEDGKAWTLLFDIAAPGTPLALDARAKATTIFLEWNPTEDDDLWGYNVYRTDHPYGTFAPVNNGIIERIAYYEDKGLDENQMYYYRVTAVDSSGNEGPQSATLEITTNPPSQAGWPIMGGEAMYGTPVTADVDLDGDLEVIVGSGEVYGWHHDGVEITDGDGDPRTEGVLAAEGTGGYRSSIAVGEMDGDPNPEIVGAAWGEVTTRGRATYEVYAWNAEDGTVLPGWPVTTTHFCWATPSVVDLDHDGLDEVVIPCADSYLYAWDSDGTGLINPSGIFGDLRYNFAYASCSVADIDGDYDLEVLAPSRSGSLYCFNPDGSYADNWPVNMGGSIRSTPATGDVTNNGQIEIVAAVNTGQVWLMAADGALFPNWPKSCQIAPDDFSASPTIADLDDDGDLEIIMVSSDGFVHVWTWEGGVFPGWPVEVDNDTTDKRGSAVVGDIDGDPEMEIVLGTSSGKVYAFDPDGDLLPGWPIQTDAEVHSTPTLDDLDRDGDLEVIVSGMDAMVYVWDCDGNYADGDGVEWATFMHDAKRTSYYGYEDPVGISDGEVETVAGFRLAQNTPNPFNPVTTIAFVVPEGASEMELCVYNVAGVKVATLVSGRVPAGRRSVVWDGTDSAGEPVASGIYFVRLSAESARLTRKVVLLK